MKKHAHIRSELGDHCNLCGDPVSQPTPERSVEETAKKFNNDMAFKLSPSNDTMKAVRLAHKMVIELLQTERQKREEMVSKIFTDLEKMRDEMQEDIFDTQRYQDYRDSTIILTQPNNNK